MYHDANGKVGMKMRTTALMAKFGITTIPALVLLDEHGRVICTEEAGCVALTQRGWHSHGGSNPRLAR
jgi:hypothetical protein